MSKDSYRDRLVAYLDGELTVGERAELENHLKKCPGCRKELAGLRSTLELVRLDAPPRFAGVKWAVPGRSPVRWWRWLWIPGLAAAAVLVAILGGDFLSGSGPEEKADWVVVEGDSLSVDEGVNLALTLIREDRSLKESLAKYDEDLPRDIYSEIEELSEEEEEAFISLLEAKTEELERS